MATSENKPFPGKRPVTPALPAAWPTLTPSAFDLLGGRASEVERRMLQRILSEWTRGDENSFPFQLALLTKSQWRAAASVPGEVARVLEDYRHTAQDAAGRIVEASEAKLADFTAARTDVRETAAELKVQVGQLGAVGRAAEARLQELTREFERVLATARQEFGAELAERRKQVWRWAAGVSAAATVILSTAGYLWQRHARETWQAGEITRLEEWHAQKQAEFAQKNARNGAEWKAWAEKEVNRRWQQVEPATYRLAQQIEKSSRPVRLADGQAGREVRLFAEAGVIDAEIAFDPETYQKGFRVYLRNDPARAMATAPPPAPSGGGSGKGEGQTVSEKR